MPVPGDGPKISIVVAVRNGEATLERCIRSATTQTYANIELIIIDGASTDCTVEIDTQNAH